MGPLSRVLALLLAALSAVGLSACGGSGAANTVGAGAISVTAFDPDPIPAGPSVPFTITGTNFQTATGNFAIVRFRALDGTPFAGGTEDTADVEGEVFGDDWIVGNTPEMAIAPGDGVTLEITLILESGVQVTFAGTGVP